MCKIETWIPIIIALISTGIVIYDRIKKSKIGIKILSFAYSPKGTFNSIDMNRQLFTIEGQQYFFKFSIQVTQKDFFFNDLKINVKYPNDDNKYRAKIFWSDPITWTFEDGKIFDLHIPKNNFLLFNNTLPLNIASFQYLSFMVEVEKVDVIEEIEIIFVEPNGKTKRVDPIKISEINSMTALFDKEIWIEKL